MLELKKGIEILARIGGIDSLDEAKALFAEKMNDAERAKLDKITTEDALIKIANSIAICQPDSVMVNTGSAEDLAFVRQLSRSA